MAAGEYRNAIPEFLIPRWEFPNATQLEQVESLGELAVAAPVAAQNALEPFREAHEFRNGALMAQRLERLEGTDQIGFAFLMASANLFNNNLDQRVRFDQTTIRATGAAIRSIKAKAGEGAEVYDPQRRVVRMQIFLKRAVEWSQEGRTPSGLIIPRQGPAGPGGRVRIIDAA